MRRSSVRVRPQAPEGLVRGIFFRFAVREQRISRQLSRQFSANSKFPLFKDIRSDAHSSAASLEIRRPLVREAAQNQACHRRRVFGRGKDLPNDRPGPEPSCAAGGLRLLHPEAQKPHLSSERTPVHWRDLDLRA